MLFKQMFSIVCLFVKALFTFVTLNMWCFIVNSSFMYANWAIVKSWVGALITFIFCCFCMISLNLPRKFIKGYWHLFGCGLIFRTSPLEGTGKQFEQHFFFVSTQKHKKFIKTVAYCKKIAKMQKILTKGPIQLQFWTILFPYKLCVNEKQSMARANLNKSEWLVTNTTTASKYIPKRPRICINWNPPFQTSLHKIFEHCFLWSKSYFTRRGILLSKFWSADSGFFRYVLWCCGSICHQPFAFIHVGFGHTV